MKSWRILRFDFSAPIPGGGPQPQLLPHLQQALHDGGDADGAHEVRAQGPECIRRAW